MQLCGVDLTFFSLRGDKQRLCQLLQRFGRDCAVRLKAVGKSRRDIDPDELAARIAGIVRKLCPAPADGRLHRVRIDAL